MRCSRLGCHAVQRLLVATPFPLIPSDAWLVNFDFGTVFPWPDVNPLYVRAVRSGL